MKITKRIHHVTSLTPAVSSSRYTDATPTTLEISPANLVLKIGDLANQKYVVRDSVGFVLGDEIVSWSSSSNSVATVSSSGVVTAIGLGEASITANLSSLYSNVTSVKVAATVDDFVGGNITVYQGTIPALSTDSATGIALVVIPIASGDLVGYEDSNSDNITKNYWCLHGTVINNGIPAYARISNTDGTKCIDFTVGALGSSLVSYSGTWQVGDHVEIPALSFREQPGTAAPVGGIVGLLNIFAAWWKSLFKP